MKVKERLKLFIKNQKLTIVAFEESIGVSNGYVNSISNNLGIDKICILLEKYPNINLNWLFTGNGEMLKATEEKRGGLERIGVDGAIVDCGNCKEKYRIAILEEKIKTKEKEIEFLQFKLEHEKNLLTKAVVSKELV